MKKSVFGRKLGRNTNQRKALFRSLVSELFLKGQIITTLAKAKAVKKEAEKLITKARKGTLTDRRVVHRFLTKRSLVNFLFDKIAPQLKERKSGYLRILKLNPRKGDCAPLAHLSFVDNLNLNETREINENKKEKKDSKVATKKTAKKENTTQNSQNEKETK